MGRCHRSGPIGTYRHVSPHKEQPPRNPSTDNRRASRRDSQAQSQIYCSNGDTSTDRPPVADVFESLTSVPTPGPTKINTHCLICDGRTASFHGRIEHGNSDRQGVRCHKMNTIAQTFYIVATLWNSYTTGWEAWPALAHISSPMEWPASSVFECL